MKRSYLKKVTETESLSQDDTDVDSKLEMMGMKLKKSKKEIVTESPTSLALVPMVPMKAQLICTTCTKKFTYKKNFVRHQAVHSHTRPFHCEFCWRRFPTDFGRKQHTRVHLADTKIKTENNSSSSSRRSSSNSSSNVDTANNNNSSSSTIRKKVVSLPVVNQDLKQGRVGRCVTGEGDYCKCQICGKIFARWWFLNNHIASMHTPCAMREMANRNKRATHEDGFRLPTIVKTEAGKDEDNCAIKSDAQTEITKNMSTRKKTRTKYVCNICQHKFQLYAQMCKHKRDSHNKTLLELEDVPENAALNLNSFIDGTSDSLSHFTKYVKIRGYTSMYDYDSDYTQPTSIEWSEYNFPSSFHIPVEESKCSGVSCISDTPSTSIAFKTTRAEFDNDEEVSSKDKSNNQSEDSLKPFSVKSHGDENSSGMRVEEFSDYMKKNPIIQWGENSSDTNEDLINNDLCLAGYASCDSASKFRESVDKTNNDSHKVSSDVQNGLVPRKNLKDFERSVPSLSFWEKHNLSLDYSQVQHERHTITDYICSVCHKHFRTLDLCLRHQQERHPHIDCHLLEGEHSNGIAARHYPIPSRIGLLAHSTIDLAVRTNFKCTKCTNFFASVTQLHHHIADCATKPDVTTGRTANRLGKKPFLKAPT